MEAPSPRDRITPNFNVAMFLFSAALGVFKFLLSEKAKSASTEGLVLSIGVDAIRFLVVMFITAWFVREFWRRLISDVFAVRPLETEEAIAIVLLFSIIFQ